MWKGRKLHPDSIDKSKAIIQTTIECAKVNRGLLFISDLYIPTLAASASYYIGYETGENSVCYTPTDVQNDSALLKVEFFEDAEFEDGTPVEITNKNRISENEPTMSIVSAPTVTEEGDLLTTIILIGSETFGNNRTGGRASSENKYILKPNTKYLAKITNMNSETCKIAIRSEFFE